MEEMYIAKYGERALSFYALSRCNTFPNLQVFTNTEVLLTLTLWDFMEALT